MGSVFILRREDSFVVIAPWEHADPVEKWMKEKSGEEAVEIEQMSDTAAITIEGPESWRLFRSFFQRILQA